MSQKSVALVNLMENVLNIFFQFSYANVPLFQKAQLNFPEQNKTNVTH